MTDLQRAIDAMLAFLYSYRKDAPKGWQNVEFLGTKASEDFFDLDGQVYIEARKEGLVDELPGGDPGAWSGLGRTRLPVHPSNQPAWSFEWEQQMLLLRKLGGDDKATPGTSSKFAGKNVNARMLAKIQADTECRGWTSKQWATFLKCSKPAVTATPTWDALKEHRDTLAAERARAHRRKPKASDQR